MTAEQFERGLLREFGERVPVVGGVVRLRSRPACHPRSRLAVWYRWRERQVVVSCEACDRPVLTLDVRC